MPTLKNNMKKLKEYKNMLIPFFLVLILIVVYKSLDNLSSLGKNLYSFIEIIKPFIVGFIIAYIINLPAKKLEEKLGKSKKKFLCNNAKGISIATVFILAVLIVFFAVRGLVPALYKNLVDLLSNSPGYINKAIGYVEQWQNNVDIRIFQFDEKAGTKAIEDFIKSFDLTELSKYAEGVINLTSGVMNTFISVIAAVYMLIDKDRIINSIKKILSILWSEEKARSLCDYFGKINGIFSKYIYCRVMDAFIISVLSTIVMYILQVKYALVLGLMVGIFSLIPYFGAIISAVIVMIITLVTGGFFKMLWVGIALFILQQIDGNYIDPKITGNFLKIRPLSVILAVTVGGGLFGTVGLLFSVPIAVVVKMIIEDYLRNKEERIKKM